MLKKMIAVSSLLATGLTFAASAPMMNIQQTNPFNGFYVGAGIGAGNFGYNSRVSAFNVIQERNSVSSSTGLFEQLNTGYDFAINHWVLGTELFGNLDNMHARHTLNLAGILDGIQKVSITSEYGLALRAGYQWNSNLFYLMTGPQATHFEVKNYANAGGNILETSSCRNLAGLLVGGGVEQALTDHLRLKEQVTYSINRGASLSDVDTSSTANYTNLRKLGAMLGLAYQF